MEPRPTPVRLWQCWLRGGEETRFLGEASKRWQPLSAVAQQCFFRTLLATQQTAHVRW